MTNEQRRDIAYQVMVFLSEQDADGAQTVNLGALVTDDDSTTLRDLVRKYASNTLMVK